MRQVGITPFPEVKTSSTDVVIGSRSQFEVGSMSGVLGKDLAGYAALPEWTDDPTDSSLREIEVSDSSCKLIKSSLLVRPGS